MVIGISGAARSGKDTFFYLLNEKMKKMNFSCNRSAFADNIKQELKDVILNNFGIDVFNPSEKEKNLIRPLLVAYGTDLGRALDENIWIKRILPKIKKEQKQQDVISVITDIRYPNEQNFLRNTFNNFQSVHIERFNCPPANKEEKTNNPKLRKNSDYIISWGDFNGNYSIGDPFIDGFINERIKIRQRNNKANKEGDKLI
jgi:hypothetical protein